MIEFIAEGRIVTAVRRSPTEMSIHSHHCTGLFAVYITLMGQAPGVPHRPSTWVSYRGAEQRLPVYFSAARYHAFTTVNASCPKYHIPVYGT